MLIKDGYLLRLNSLLQSLCQPSIYSELIVRSKSYFVVVLATKGRFYPLGEIFWGKSNPHDILICKGCYNGVPQAEWFKQQKHIISWLWCLEVQNESTSSVILSEYYEEKICPSPLSHWLIDECLLPVSLHTIFPLCVSMYLIVPFIQRYRS